MPIYEIPAGAGPFAIVQANDRSFAVADERVLAAGLTPQMAMKLGLVLIPCHNEKQAKEVLEALDAGSPEEDRRVQVDLVLDEST